MPRVLVVNADPEVRGALRALLLDNHYDVEEAANAPDALVRAGRRPPDLLLTDLLPPALGGFDLLRRWKAEPALRAIPVLVLTAACRDPEDEQLIRALGAEAVVRRPAAPEATLAAIRDLLDRAAAGSTAGTAGFPGASPDLERLLAGRWVAAQEALVEVERALGQREARLRTIIATEPECIKLLARDGSLLEMNPAGLRMLEAESFEEVRLRCVYPLVVEEHRAAFRALIERAFAGASGTLEFEMVGLKGGRRWLETQATPLRDAAGRVEAVLGVTRDITERKRTELALRESEARYRTLFESAADPVLVADREGRLLDANAAACRAFGYDRDELIGLRAVDILAPEEAPRVGPEIARLRAGEVVRSEWRCRRKDGTGFDGEVHATVLPDGRLLGVLRDVSEQRRSAAALERARERLQHIVEATNAGTWEWNVQTGETVFDERWAAMLGYRLSELEPVGSDTWTRLAHPDDLARANALLARHFAGELPYYDMELRLRHKDGRWVWVHDRGRVIDRTPDGRPLWMFGTQTDITERKEAEAALQRSEAQFRLLIAHAPEAIVLLDVATGKFVLANAAAERLFKLPERDLFKVGPVDLSPPAQPDGRPSAAKARELIEAALAGDTPAFEWTHLDAEGREIPCEVRLLRLEAEGRTVVRGSIVDIAERKAAERRIRQLNRTYAMLSEVNQAIVRERDLRVLLATICRVAVERGGFPLVWIGLADGEGRLRVAAHAGAGPDTLALVRALVEGPEPDCAFTYEALRAGVPAACQDIAADPRAKGWRAAALARGFAAMASLPLRVAGRAAGTFNLYAGEREFFDPEELGLLTELAADIGFALEVAERERERVRAEQALRESEERFREIAETVEEVFWIGDARGERIQYVSPAYERIWGRPRSALLETPHDWQAAVHPDDRDRVARDTGSPAGADCDLEYRIVRPEGEVRWVRHRALPVRDSAGQVVRVVTVASDITDRKLAQAELERREQRFRLLIENAPDMILVVDDTGVLRFRSPSATQVFGYQDEEMMGRNVLELVHPDDLPAVQAALAEARANPGRPVRAEFRARHREGHWLTLETVGRSLPEQAPEGFIVLNARDRTEVLRLEEQFRQAQKLEAIGRLAGGVAHDFNNILAVVLMQADLTLTDPGLTEETRESLQAIRAAARRAGDLTRQLLLFGRRQVMQPRELDLNAAVTSLAGMLQRLLGEDVHLELHLHPVPLTVRADPGMLDQVLMNLAVNARDAMPGGGRLVIETTTRTVTPDLAARYPQAAPGEYACVRVADTGHGIPADVLPHIFEPFFTTKEPGKGTGLGLATVFGIVKQHGGAVAVFSEPGQGATFEILLPVGPAGVAALAPAPRPAALRRGEETVLVVEDDPAVRRLTRLTLERHGYRVLEAADGPEAERRWREHQGRIDLLLTDVVLPSGVSGHELARRLSEAGHGLRVVFTSGYSPEIAGRELELGERERFVQKPYTPDELLEAVRRSLEA
ncbi:MAG TPA: PAS domain S-box protein [Gemmatimonadales bacterium]|nr:PAS domain S-box protein [Gemmatimonadales bacterium]